MKNTLLFLCLLIELSAQAQPRQDSLALLNENAGILHHYLSNPDSVMTIAHKTLDAAKAKKFSYIEGECYFILSKANWAKANYLLSTEYGFKALRIFENSKYVMYWGETILTLARNYIDLREFDQAKGMIHSALHLAKSNHHEKLLADSYREYTILLNNVQQYDSSLRVADEALRYYEKVNDLSNACILYGRKGDVYRLQNDFENSMRFNEKSIQAALQSDNKRSLSIEYYHAAQHYFRLNNMDSTKKLLEASLALARHIGNLPVQIRCHDLMAAVYERQHKIADELSEFKIISLLKDSLQLREKSRQVAETFALQELENKEAAIVRLEKENESEKQLVKTQQLVSGFLVVTILLLLLLVLVLWTLRKNQFRANKLLTEKNAAIEQQRKEIHEQAENLQRVNQVKTKLFSLISHDLRGPISNIQSLLSMLTQRIMTVEEFIAVAEPLKAGLNLNQRTLENLLNWSLSQMEGIRTDTTAFNINSVIHEVSQLMHGIATQKEITIQNLEGCHCSVLADYNQVHLILRNIIHNAIKFSPNHKAISISTESVKGFCKVVVRDHGVGLSESEIETLLNPNDYYSKAGTQYEKGTGLGLLLCKEFIKRNGGTFHIESDPVKGTEVSFTLPLAAIL
jgi:two-component system, sensor histidine kinase and response regulator